MTEAVEDRSRITWVIEVSFLVRREASVSAAATHLRPKPRAARVTKVTSTRIWIFLKPNTFLCELAFRLHETSESAHRNRIIIKPLYSGVF